MVCDGDDRTTAACSPQAPRFRWDSYSFQVDALASVGKSVGSVTAVDLNGDSVSHSITAGNEEMPGSPSPAATARFRLSWGSCNS